DATRVHGVEVGIPTAVFHGYLTTSSSLSREQVITLVAESDDVKCQNSGILDKGRCTCPPGFYALNCESRGCMPSVQSNLDTSRQSFILVLSLRSSMGYDLHQLIEQLPTWISDIGKAAPGLIDNFIKSRYEHEEREFFTSAACSARITSSRRVHAAAGDIGHLQFLPSAVHSRTRP
ncbi:hypothetical protein OSTOST_08867, partial [Ostertagia ostertagi]